MPKRKQTPQAKRKPVVDTVVDDDGTTIIRTRTGDTVTWAVVIPPLSVTTDDPTGGKLIAHRHLDTKPEVFFDAHERRVQRAAHRQNALDTAEKKRAESDGLLNAIEDIKQERRRIAETSEVLMGRSTDGAAARTHRDKVVKERGKDPGDVHQMVKRVRNARRRKKLAARKKQSRLDS